MPKSFVDQILIGRMDGSGNQILAVYAKNGAMYAVYRTPERVVVQFADDDKTGDEQRAALAPLNPVRGEINGLVDGWRNSPDPDKQSKAKLFDRRVADALVNALQKDPSASELMNKIKADVLAERTSAARSDYMIVAAITTLTLIAAVWLVTSDWWQVHPVFKNLWPMAGFGALGALFSIALSIRDRSILTDLQSRDNAVDAILRVLIGATSAMILYSLLRAGLVEFNIGAAPGSKIFDEVCVPRISCTTPGQYVLIVVAFIAGFSERLVSQILSQAAVTVGGSSNPLAGGAAAKSAPPAAPAVAVAPGGAPAAPAAALGDDAAEGCVSDHPVPESQQTSDVELPEATGGVETPADAPAN